MCQATRSTYLRVSLYGTFSIHTSAANVSLAVTTNRVVWCSVSSMDPGAIRSVEKTAQHQLAYPSQSFRPFSVAADDARMYWGNNATEEDPAMLRSCPLEGCGEAQPLVITQNASSIDNLVLDDDYVYWVEGSATSASRIMRVAKP